MSIKVNVKILDTTNTDFTLKLFFQFLAGQNYLINNYLSFQKFEYWGVTLLHKNRYIIKQQFYTGSSH